MPYERTSQEFNELAEEALNNEEIQRGAKQAGLQRRFLQSELANKAPQVWGAAASEIEAFNQLEYALSQARRVLSALKGDAKLRQGRATTTFRGIRWLAVASGILTVLGTIRLPFLPRCSAPTRQLL
jgi:hypothetical protein